MSEEMHLLSGAYVVAALDDIERAQFKRHLADCQACQEEVRGLREASAMLASISGVTPPTALRSRVLADIATVRPLPPRTAVQPVVSSRFGRRPGLLLAAAVALAALGGTAAVTQPWNSGTGQTLTAASRVLDAPDAQRVTGNVTGQPGATMTIVRSPSQRRAVLMTRGVPSAPTGKVYQAWFREPDGHYVSAGLIPQVNSHPLVLDGDATVAVGAGLTLEPAGGSPEPTEAPRAVVSFSRA